MWEKLNFGNKDQNVKFRKLMGIKVSTVVTLHNLNVFDSAVKSSVVTFSFRTCNFSRVILNLLCVQGEEDTEVSKPLNDDGLKTLQKQEEMFRNLDVQYEMARSQTHTQRGMGLGFSSSFSRGMDSI